MKIGNKIIGTRVAWSLVEDVPLLLGRLYIFKLFNISFETDKKNVFKD